MKGVFSITPRIIAHFGEDLIKNESIALLELVKNSYDACARNCDIDFQMRDGQLESLTIIDDGFGMSLETIQKVWLVIGTDFKKKRVAPNCCGRIPLGEKGVGRLGVHKLGNHISLISKTHNEKEVQLCINWKLLDQAKEINDFLIDISENDTPLYFSQGNTGTRIVIKDLKSDWDRRKLREVYRDLTSLNSPFSEMNDSFNVNIRSNSDFFKGLPSFEDIKDSGLYFGHCVMKGGQIDNFEYEFRPWPTLNKIGQGRKVQKKDLIQEDLRLKGIKEDVDLKGRKKRVEYPIDLRDEQIGDIVFDIIIYETDPMILSFANTEKASLKSYLKENGGVRVYRDNIRVYNYGESDNDWLGIDLRRVQRVGGNVSNNIILGSVKIDRTQSKGLKEKTNREGFIENDAYKVFVDSVNYVLSLFVRERNIDKETLATLYKKNRVVEPILADLNEVIEIVDKKVPEENGKDEILKYLYRINTQYKEVKEILIKSANAGLNLSVVIHEIDKLVAALRDYAERGEKELTISISERLEKIIQGYSLMIRQSATGISRLSSIVSTAIENYSFRFSDHKIDVITNPAKSDLEAYLSESESIAVLINLLDNAIYWLCYARTENRKISLFITDQIAGYNSIIISDNGPGFNIPTDIAIKPFITGKPLNIGMGLGLHIANEMMKAMKGQLLFLGKDDVILPRTVQECNVNSAIIALCFPPKKA